MVFRFFTSCVLGDKEIRKRMGKDIFIFPFDYANLKKSSYNLTATKLAYYADDKKLALNADGDIVMEPGRTVMIQTKESIYVSNKICGTYHSKVTLMEKGFSSISTTLDPKYFGSSLIAITNLSKRQQIISPGDTFCTLILYYVKGSGKEENTNSQNRQDLMPEKFTCNDFEMDMQNELKHKLVKDVENERNAEYKKDYQTLIKTVRQKYAIQVFTKGHYLYILLCVLSFFVIYLLYSNKIISGEITFGLNTVVVGAVFAWLLNILDRWR